MRPTAPLSHLTRRDFLRVGTLAAGAFTAWAPDLFASGDSQVTTPVIDTHIHLYDPGRPGGISWPRVNDEILYLPHLPSLFQSLTEKPGVVGTVVIEGNAEPVDNQWVLDLAKDNPVIVGYIGRLMPGTSGFAPLFDRYAENPIFRGLRLSQPMLAKGWDLPDFQADLLRLEERDLTLDIVGGEPVLADVARIAKLAPGLRIVIDHLPFQEWNRNLDATRAALQEVARLPRVYGKISHVARRVDGQLVTDPEYYRPQLDLLWELFGNDRVIYGSNWPVSDLIAPYGDIFKIVADYARGRGASVAEKYFWENSIAAYHWQPRGRAAALMEKA